MAGGSEIRIDKRIDESYAALSPQERCVADFLLDHLGDLAVFSSADISRETGVSKATVSRLFRKLGFADFKEVREHARSMRNRGVPMIAPGVSGADAESTGLERHAAAEVENIVRTIGRLGDGRLDEAVDLLAGARSVLVIGMRNAYPVALHLDRQLTQVRPGVRVAPQPGQTIGEEIAGLASGDVVVLVGFRRRPAVFARLAAALADSPADVVLLADGTGREYAVHARCWLEVSLDSGGAFDSYAAAMSAVGLLANGVLNRLVSSGRRRVGAIDTAYEELAEIEGTGAGT